MEIRSAAAGADQRKSSGASRFRSAGLELSAVAVVGESLWRVRNECRNTIAIDCNAKGMTFKVARGDRLLQFHSDNLSDSKYGVYFRRRREIVCGPRKPENAVVMTYAGARARHKADGKPTH